MSFLRWQVGRQRGGYDKLLLLSSAILPFDIYLLRYRKGSYVDLHIDPVEEGEKHFRLNIELWRADEGGIFEVPKYGPGRGGPIFKWGRVTLFRPDKLDHSVTEIKAGSRWVLSIGWVW
jgi:hypothetical protein